MRLRSLLTASLGNLVGTNNHIMLFSGAVKLDGPLARTRHPDRSLNADTRAFYAAFSELIRWYQFRDRDRICCHNVSVTQCYALEVLAQHRSRFMTLNELAARLCLDKSTSSRVIDALERKGYVERLAHAEDGRAVELRITRSGRQLYKLLEREALAEKKALLASFSSTVRRAMTQMIRRLVTAAKECNQCSGATGCCSN